jgi:hypothetical protein
VYALRHEYVRKGVRDMFHVVEGILKCVYTRTFHFRDDGQLMYALMPGALAVAITVRLRCWYRGPQVVRREGGAGDVEAQCAQSTVARSEV